MRFPKASAVVTDLLAKDAKFSADLAAFYEGLSSEEPRAVEYDVGPRREGEHRALAVQTLLATRAA